MSELAELPNEDGRRARRNRNRYAVVDAYLDLVRHGNPRPSVADVAEHSGVSHRSVFRYFADKDELARTAIERQHDVARPLVALTVGPGAPLDDRLEKFVARRLDLYEVTAPVARLSRSLVSVQPVLSAELAVTRQFLRHQIEQLFAAELDAMEPDDATQTLAALDVLCSFEGVDLMAIDQRLDRPTIEAALRRAMARLLTSDPTPSERTNMYGSIRHEIRINRKAADVWALAGDETKLHTWFPGIIDSTVEGRTRTIVMGSGMPMPEEILVNDDTQRRFQYRITAPMFKHHRGTIDVIDLGDETSLVVYSTEADPRTMALVIGGGTAGALAELKRQMELVDQGGNH